MRNIIYTLFVLSAISTIFTACGGDYPEDIYVEVQTPPSEDDEICIPTARYEDKEMCFDGLDNDCDGWADQPDWDCTEVCEPARSLCDDNNPETEDWCSPLDWRCHSEIQTEPTDETDECRSDSDCPSDKSFCIYSPRFGFRCQACFTGDFYTTFDDGCTPFQPSCNREGNDFFCECIATQEICDEIDNNCDGQIDEYDVCNHVVEDSDGDGVPDDEDNCPNLSNPDQGDYDEDGTGDECDNCLMQSNPDQQDLDENDVGDACQHIAEDNDGDCMCEGLTVLYAIPLCFQHDGCEEVVFGDCNDYDPDYGPWLNEECTEFDDNDRDGDGHMDEYDNCPRRRNYRQYDSDSDGVGDECDNCPLTMNPDQISSNINGVGDACAGETLNFRYETRPSVSNINGNSITTERGVLPEYMNNAYIKVRCFTSLGEDGPFDDYHIYEYNGEEFSNYDSINGTLTLNGRSELPWTYCDFSVYGFCRPPDAEHSNWCWDAIVEYHNGLVVHGKFFVEKDGDWQELPVYNNDPNRLDQKWLLLLGDL